MPTYAPTRQDYSKVLSAMTFNLLHRKRGGRRYAKGNRRCAKGRRALTAKEP